MKRTALITVAALLISAGLTGIEFCSESEPEWYSESDTDTTADRDSEPEQTQSQSVAGTQLQNRGQNQTGAKVRLIWSKPGCMMAPERAIWSQA